MAKQLKKPKKRPNLGRRLDCSCGCLERGSVAPVFDDPRAGSSSQELVRPAQWVPEPDPSEKYEEWVLARSKNWVHEFSAIFGSPQTGRHRSTFLASSHVYKVPLCTLGMEDNLHEASFRSCHHASAWVVADADGFPLLIMEKVSPVFSEVDWVGTVDCGQVGRSCRTGNLVAYDYGYY